MLYPPVSNLLKNVDSRYLLVNVVAHRARQISIEAEENQEPLTGRKIPGIHNIDVIHGGCRYLRILTGGRKLAADAEVDKSKPLIRPPAKEFFVFGSIQGAGFGECSGFFYESVYILRRRIYTVPKDLLPKGNEQGKDPDVVLFDQFRGKVTGAV